MRFFDIHVTYNLSGKDGDGYSIFVKVNGDDNEAIKYAVKNHLFTEDGDEKFIDYVDEIDENDYLDATEW